MSIDLRAITADQAIDAMILVDGLRVTAASLRPGDRIVYRDRAGYVVTTVPGVTPEQNNWVRVDTDADSWSCSPDNTRQLRVYG